MPGKAINDLGQRAVKENSAVVDYQHTVAKFFDVLHVMAGEQRDNAMFLVVNAQKLADAFLTDHIQANGRFIEKKHARLMNKRSDQLHFHALAQRKFTYHHVHFISHFQELR